VAKLQAIGQAANRSFNGGVSMQTHVNSASIRTVELAANRFNHLAPPPLSGQAARSAAMDKRLALLHKAMGEEVPHQASVTRVTGNTAPSTKSVATSAPLQHVLLSGMAGLIAVAGVLWFLQDSRSAAVIVPVASTVAPPVAMVVTPSAPTPGVVPPTRSDEEEAVEMVENWRKAWSRRDVNAYLGHYSAQFVPASGQSQEQWATKRRTAIAGRADIQVSIRELRTERIDERSMNIAFLQDYASGKYLETAQPKILGLLREDSGWRIVSERALPVGTTLAP
jgi:ketosteroid isomerase-like protein